MNASVNLSRMRCIKTFEGEEPPSKLGGIENHPERMPKRKIPPSSVDGDEIASAKENGALTTSPTSHSCFGVADPEDNDVLLGRGDNVNRHPGNKIFRDLVDKQRKVYLASQFKREKRMIADVVMSAVRDLRPPGRFLKKDAKTGLWKPVEESVAREKTLQALREKTKSTRSQGDGTASIQQSESSADLDTSELSSVEGLPSRAQSQAAPQHQHQHHHHQQQQQQQQQQVPYYAASYPGPGVPSYPVYFQGYISYPVDSMQTQQYPNHQGLTHYRQPQLFSATSPMRIAAQSDFPPAAVPTAVPNSRHHGGWNQPPKIQPPLPTPLGQPPPMQHSHGLNQATEHRGNHSSNRDGGSPQIFLQRPGFGSSSGESDITAMTSMDATRAVDNYAVGHGAIDRQVAARGVPRGLNGTPFSLSPHDAYDRFLFPESPGTPCSFYGSSPADGPSYAALNYDDPLSPRPLPPNFNPRMSPPTRSPPRPQMHIPTNVNHPSFPPAPPQVQPPNVYSVAQHGYPTMQQEQQQQEQQSYPILQKEQLQPQQVQPHRIHLAPDSAWLAHHQHQQQEEHPQQQQVNGEQKDHQEHHQQRQDGMGIEGLAYSPVARARSESREGPHSSPYSSFPAISGVDPRSFENFGASPAFMRLFHQQGDPFDPNSPANNPRRLPLPGATLSPRFQRGGRNNANESYRRDGNIDNCGN